MYLVNGLIQYDYKNLETRKFIKESSFEFYEWANEDTIKINTEIDKTSLFNQFIGDYPDYATGQFKLTQKRFWLWVDKYCQFNKLEIDKRFNSMGQRIIEVKKV